LLAHGRWFSPGIPASSTTKTGRHDIAEINIAECGVKHNKSNQISELRLHIISMVSSNLYYFYSLGFIIEKGAKGILLVKI
jgi:hypothetical protein